MADATTPSTGEGLLAMTGIVKEFPGVRALDGVGKSTLIKVLAGAHQPDSGTISWQGDDVRLTNPQAAMRRGIATIYQELDLVDGLSVAENVFLGREHSGFGF